ncbi:MAG TPA: ROK family protein, partial [Alphaproteobacteria bacterium]|nr:ROK family protein [Alphaproteobacteria bacterium]
MRIGIDLGGTKTEIICLDERTGEMLTDRFRNNSPRDYDESIHNMANLVRAVEAKLGQEGTIGVGIPGTIDEKGLVKNANSTWLNGRPLDKDLGMALGGRKVRVQNDANCFAVSEATDGAGAGHKVVFAIIAGTGCGAGVVVDGRPVSGLNGLGGEWGHNPLPLPRVYAPDFSQHFKIFDAGTDPEKMINSTYAAKGRPQYFT